MFPPHVRIHITIFLMSNRTYIVCLVAVLAGCANSPARVSRMAPAELVEVDDYVLCKAATPRQMYDPSGPVRAEVRRRGLQCADIYTYREPFPAGTIAPIPTPVAPSPVVVQQPATPATTTCYTSTNGRVTSCY